MDITELNIEDDEAINSAYRQINYYSNLPKHIKESASDFELIYPTNFEVNSELSPAHVVAGSITVIEGKLNMPSLDFTQN